MNPALIQLAIEVAPQVIALLKDAFRRDNPDAQSPTDTEIIAAYALAFQSSMARDAEWLARHPEG
jgi:hypothetical protein